MIKNLAFDEGKTEIMKISNKLKKEAETLLQRVIHFQQKIDKCKTKEEVEKINYDEL